MGLGVAGLVFWQLKSLGNSGKSCPSAQPHSDPAVGLGVRLRVGERGLHSAWFSPGALSSRAAREKGRH